MIKSSLCLLLILSLFGCRKEYDCTGFDNNHPLLQITISPSLADTIEFRSEDDETVKMWILYDKISDPYTELCSEFNRCHCRSEFYAAYSNNQSGFFCRSNIDEFLDFDENVRFCSFGFNSEKPIYSNSFDNTDSNSYQNFIETLVSDSILYENKYYYNIIEFGDSLTQGDYISKIWIRPGIGLYKFWKANKCWTRIE